MAVYLLHHGDREKDAKLTKILFEYDVLNIYRKAEARDLVKSTERCIPSD